MIKYKIQQNSKAPLSGGWGGYIFLKLLCLMLLMMVGSGSLHAVDYLCFTAVEAGSTLKLSKVGDITANIRTSTDGTTWNDYAFDTNIELAGIGDKVYFKGDYQGKNPGNYASFIMSGKIAASGNIMTLTDGDNPGTSLESKDYCFVTLFGGCEALNAAPELPATTLADSCYANMFWGCTGLIEAPALPATTLTDGCYLYMFGSTGLTEAPELSAMTLAKYCYSGMFYNCTGLTEAPALPATTLAEGCYFAMFYRCENLTQASALPATTLALHCYFGMFFGCENLTQAPALPAMNLAPYCYAYMFFGCQNLTQAPALPAMNLAPYCYYTMFAATRLTSAPQLSATNLAPNCYEGMFYGCKDLTQAPALPAMNLVNGCYAGMFRSSGLTEAPALPATNLVRECYDEMFHSCNSLTQAPALPATTLAPNCYHAMFYQCENLTTAPELSAMNLADSCYREMFAFSGLTQAPELPATNLFKNCYSNMFASCMGLTEAPKQLPATTLAEECYSEMFAGTNLTKAPELPATTLVRKCYRNMFDGCHKLNYLKVNFTLWEEDINATFGWVRGVSSVGTFVCPMDLNTSARNDSHVPQGWTVEHPPYLCFTAEEAGSVKLNVTGSIAANIQTSTDGFNWENYTFGTNIPLAVNEKVYFKGNYQGTGMSDYASFEMTGKINASGNVMTLTDGDNPTGSLEGKDYCFFGLFFNCESLTKAPGLPATTLAPHCYLYMFAATRLTSAPQLSATNLAPNCYEGMFYGCKALTQAPALPVMNLANGCYAGMFRSSGLTEAPALPATNLVRECYNEMFHSCNSLTQAPALPATTLAPNCYHAMFYQCENLTTAPELSAMNLADSCYREMFAFSGLTKAPELPATNLFKNCYSYMFAFCENLTVGPELPATTLVRECYSNMFDGCNKLNYLKVNFTSWAEDIDATSGWVIGVPSVGTFVCPMGLNTSARDESHVPPGWTVKHPPYLCFIAEEAGSVKLNVTGTIAANIQTSMDGFIWQNYTFGTNIPLAAGEKVYFKGNYQGTGTDNYASFVMSGKINASGNVMTLTDGDNPTGSLEDKDYCFYKLFSYCTSLTAAPGLSATTLATNCYREMFYGCTGITEAPVLPATALADHCYREMFYGCIKLNYLKVKFTSWTDATLNWVENVSATGTFVCPAQLDTSISDASHVPVGWTPTADYLCFTAEEANSSIRLHVIGDITANIQIKRDTCNWENYEFDTNINLAAGEKIYFKGDYKGKGSGSYALFIMSGKISASGNVMTLTDGDNPDTSLAGKDYCFFNLFAGCRSLTTAPELPATTLSEYCYASMFHDCEYLAKAPDLPATTLANYCYQAMFFGCSGLTKAPALPATTLADGCYSEMFRNCKGLTAAPELPATTLTQTCYQRMFNGCTNLNYLKVNFTSWADDINATSHWVEHVSANGTFMYPEGLDVSTRNVSRVPEGWTVRRIPEYLCFTAQEAGYVALIKNGSITADIETSTDGFNWQNYTFGTNIPLAVGDRVYFKGNYQGMGLYDFAWFAMSGKISASGNIMTLTDGDNPGTSLEGKDYCFYMLFGGGYHGLTKAPELPATTLAKGCYNTMFYYCVNLTEAPELPATTLAESCYTHMFTGCTSLTETPELPATTLAEGCYAAMFWGCTSLTKAPALPATTLAEECYRNMFNHTKLTAAPVLPAKTLAKGCYQEMFINCEGLTAAPELPATTLANYCYFGMFWGCTGLTAAPELHATTLAKRCYSYMFYKCTSLTAAPELPATTLADHCYDEMFFGCGGLTQAPELPATTLAPYCYRFMFQGCTSLTTAPALPATNLANYCYYGMFANCPDLTAAPELSVTTLTLGCYEFMFYNAGLTAAPELPATTLAKRCYLGMFQGCTDLTTAPELPATTLVDSCYYAMFHECTSLNYLKVHFTSWADATDPTTDWVVNVSATGTFACSTGLDTSTRDVSHVPEGWTVDFISGISPVMDSRFDPKGVIHNISGQRVDENYKGIVIQNGRKYFRKH